LSVAASKRANVAPARSAMAGPFPTRTGDIPGLLNGPARPAQARHPVNLINVTSPAAAAGHRLRHDLQALARQGTGSSFMRGPFPTTQPATALRSSMVHRVHRRPHGELCARWRRAALTNVAHPQGYRLWARNISRPDGAPHRLHQNRPAASRIKPSIRSNMGPRRSASSPSRNSFTPGITQAQQDRRHGDGGDRFGRPARPPFYGGGPISRPAPALIPGPVTVRLARNATPRQEHSCLDCGFRGASIAGFCKSATANRPECPSNSGWGRCSSENDFDPNVAAAATCG